MPSWGETVLRPYKKSEAGHEWGLAGRGWWFGDARLFRFDAYLIARRLAALPNLVDPTAKEFVVGILHIDELDTHADPRLQDPHYRECFYGLPFPGHHNANTGADRNGLAAADEAAAERQIRSNATGAGTGFHVDDLDVGCEGKADGIAAVADASLQ